MRVVLYSADLAVSSRLDAAARGRGLTPQATANAESLLELARGARLVVIDLQTATADGIAELVKELRGLDSPPPRIIAFGPHVHEQTLAAARAAKCDEVLSRGQFFRRMAEVLEC